MTDLEMWTKAFFAALAGTAAKNIHISESKMIGLNGTAAMKVSALGIEGALVQSAITIANGAVSALAQAERYYASKEAIEAAGRDTDVGAS